MTKFRYRTPNELRSYDTYKLGALLIALLLLIVGLWRPTYKAPTIAAGPGVPSPATGFRLGLDVDAFGSPNDLGAVMLNGSGATGDVQILDGDVEIANIKPLADGKWSYRLAPLTNWMGKTLRAVCKGQEETVDFDRELLRRGYGQGMLSGGFEIVQDPVNDSKFNAQLKGLNTGGDTIRVLVDGVKAADVSGESGAWRFETPFEQLQNKIVTAQLLSPEGTPVGEIITVLDPPSQEEVKNYSFDLKLPAPASSNPLGVTTFSGHAPPGMFLLVYVDKWIVAKAIGRQDGTWECKARIKSPGPSRKLKAVSVPYQGRGARSTPVHPVTFE